MQPPTYKKLVAVGDGAVGKTCLLLVFAEGKFPQYYLPTVFEHHQKSIIVDNIKVTLELWDTAGQEEYARLRPLSYPETDVILLCVSVDLPDSLENARGNWLPEILQYCSLDVKVILVVNKADLRFNENTLNNLSFTDQVPLQEDQCKRVGKDMGVLAVIECSAKQRVGVQEVFETAARAALENTTVRALGKAKKKKPCVIL